MYVENVLIHYTNLCKKLNYATKGKLIMHPETARSMGKYGLREVAQSIESSGSAISAAIENAAETKAQAQIEASRIIAKSNYARSRSIFKASQVIFDGLSNIASEMEKKRHTDTYYMLKNKIFEMEDRIIASGHNLKKAYEKIEIKVDKIIQIKPDELKFLAYICQEEKALAWAKDLIMKYKSRAKRINVIQGWLNLSVLHIMSPTDRSCDLQVVAEKGDMTLILEKSLRDKETDLAKNAGRLILEEARSYGFDSSSGRISYSARYDEIHTYLFQKPCFLNEPYEDLEHKEAMESLSKFISTLNAEKAIRNLEMIYEGLRNFYIDSVCGE